MLSESFKTLLDQISADINALPASAVQLIGAVVAMQTALPPWFTEFLLSQLAQRVDMNRVSPAAEAVMRLSAFSRYSDMEFAKHEIRLQHSFLKAIALEDKVLVAAAFMRRMADRFERFAASVHEGESLWPQLEEYLPTHLTEVAQRKKPE